MTLIETNDKHLLWLRSDTTEYSFVFARSQVTSLNKGDHIRTLADRSNKVVFKIPFLYLAP